MSDKFEHKIESNGWSFEFNGQIGEGAGDVECLQLLDFENPIESGCAGPDHMHFPSLSSYHEFVRWLERKDA